MKRQIKLVLLMLLFATQSFAQTNILEQIQIPKINLQNWIEKDNYYYFLSIQQGGQGNTGIYGRRPMQYVLNKYDKFTLQQIDWKVVAGDTLQNDTLLTFGAYVQEQQDTLYLLYSKDWDIGAWDPESGHYIQKLDINFNTVLPEKRYDIGYESCTGPLLGCVAPLPDGTVFVGHADKFAHEAEILILGHTGEVIQSLQPGIINGPCGGGYPRLRSFAALNDQTYVISGDGLCGIPCSSIDSIYFVSEFAFQLLDSTMQLLDTFYYKLGAVTSDTPMRYNNTGNPSMIALPGGSLICSGALLSH